VTHVTCRLTAENRDQLRNPTLPLPFLLVLSSEPVRAPEVASSSLLDQAAAATLTTASLLLLVVQLHVPGAAAVQAAVGRVRVRAGEAVATTCRLPPGPGCPRAVVQPAVGRSAGGMVERAASATDRTDGAVVSA